MPGAQAAWQGATQALGVPQRAATAAAAAAANAVGACGAARCVQVRRQQLCRWRGQRRRRRQARRWQARGAGKRECSGGWQLKQHGADARLAALQTRKDGAK